MSVRNLKKFLRRLRLHHVWNLYGRNSQSSSVSLSLNSWFGMIMVQRVGSHLPLPLNSVVLLIRSVSANHMKHVGTQEGIMTPSLPRRLALSEEKWKQSVVIRNWWSDGRHFFLGSPFLFILTFNIYFRAHRSWSSVLRCAHPTSLITPGQHKNLTSLNISC